MPAGGSPFSGIPQGGPEMSPFWGRGAPRGMRGGPPRGGPMGNMRGGPGGPMPRGGF